MIKAYVARVEALECTFLTSTRANWYILAFEFKSICASSGPCAIPDLDCVSWWLHRRNPRVPSQFLYTKSTADLEARGVMENRRQNVFIALNRLHYFLNTPRNARATSSPPPLSFATSTLRYQII